MRPLLVVGALVTVGSVFGQTPDPGPRVDRSLGSAEANKVVVDNLFRAMEEGTYQELAFPKVLNWGTVPELLRHAKSKKSLKSWPVNPLSSQITPSCTEGMAALWLIEGVRAGGKFGSLNPICYLENPKGNWAKASEGYHAKVLAAYESWWAKVKSNPSQLGPKLHPLKGTKLFWH